MKNIRFLWLVITVIMLTNFITYMTLDDNLLLYISDILPVFCSIIAIVGISLAFRKFKSFDFTKIAWLLLLIGVILNFMAESIYAFLEISMHVDMNETFPSIADYFWFSGYIAFFISLIMMFIGYKKSGFPMGNLKQYGWLASLLTVIVISVIYFLLIPIVKDDETELLTKVAYLFYPIADILVVSLAVMLLLIISQFGNSIISLPWRLLALGFICFTVSDLLYSYLGWQDLYGSGNLIDLGWHMGYLLLGMSGLYQMELIESVNKKR